MNSMKDEWKVWKMNEKYEGWMKSMKNEWKVWRGNEKVSMVNEKCEQTT